MSEGSIERYADKAMFPAAEMASTSPQAHLLWMTPDPLGAVAAAVRMYKGKPTYSLADITDEERRDCWEQSQLTELKAPHEFVKLHFFIEGVPRDLTHQMVRQRTAVYAQESLRFAVKEDLPTARPPSLADPSRSISIRNDLNDIWDEALMDIQEAYAKLIANGVPAEDARGLLPGATLTRLNYCTDLRNFASEAGKRLCTQAQFHWRQTFLSMREAVRRYGLAPGEPGTERCWGEGEFCYEHNVPHWQFQLIADSNIFSPVCYQIGKCGFKAEFDRGCTIRARVDNFESMGISSTHWENFSLPDQEGVQLQPIRRAEWLEDPKAGWVA